MQEKERAWWERKRQFSKGDREMGEKVSDGGES